MWITPAFAQAVGSGSDIFTSILPLIIFTLPFAFGVLQVAPKFGRRGWLWFVLFVIPMVNVAAMPLFIILVAGDLIDKLGSISERIQALSPETKTPSETLKDS